MQSNTSLLISDIAAVASSLIILLYYITYNPLFNYLIISFICILILYYPLCQVTKRRVTGRTVVRRLEQMSIVTCLQGGLTNHQSRFHPC